MQLKNYKKLFILCLAKIKGGNANRRQETSVDGGGGVVHDKPNEPKEN